MSQEALEHYTTSRCVVFGWQPDYFDLSLSVHTITHCCVYKHFKVDTHSQLCKVMYVRVASTVWTVVAGVMIFIHHKSHTVHVTYFRKSNEFHGNPLRLAVNTCTAIIEKYLASLRIIFGESTEPSCGFALQTATIANRFYYRNQSSAGLATYVCSCPLDGKHTILLATKARAPCNL